MIESTGVWSRTAGEDALSPRAYHLIIGLVLLYGFGVNAWITSVVDPTMVASINPLFLYTLYFGSCILGSYLFVSSDKPAVSFAGYNIVIIPFGFIVSLAVQGVAPHVVRESMLLTSAIVALMGLLGVVYPRIFLGMRRTLFWTTLIVAVVELVAVFIFGVHHDIFHIIVVALMSGYVGYGFARANSIPRTLDNAIDSAANLYMSIILIFLRIIGLKRGR